MMKIDNLIKFYVMWYLCQGRILEVAFKEGGCRLCSANVLADLIKDDKLDKDKTISSIYSIKIVG